MGASAKISFAVFSSCKQQLHVVVLSAGAAKRCFRRDFAEWVDGGWVPAEEARDSVETGRNLRGLPVVFKGLVAGISIGKKRGRIVGTLGANRILSKNQ